MSISAPVYHQLLNLLRQHSQYRDFRHLKALICRLMPLFVAVLLI